MFSGSGTRSSQLLHLRNEKKMIIQDEAAESAAVAGYIGGTDGMYFEWFILSGYQ